MLRLTPGLNVYIACGVTDFRNNIDGQMDMSDLKLFNEAEALRDPINIEPQVEDVIKPRKKGKKKIFSKYAVKKLAA